MYLPDQVVWEVEQHAELDQLRAIAGCRLEICSVSQAKIDSIRQTTLPLSLTLQATDLAVLALSHETSPDFALTDDLTLRRTLEGQGHTAMGSVGLLLYAYKTGWLNQEQLDQAIDHLFVQSTLYLSPQFKSYVRKLIATKLSES
jgi:predicted nucleic acid-binding protein